MSTTDSKTPASTFGRSVVDFVSNDELKQALATVTPQGHASTDWRLPMSDPTAEEQTPERELQRLLNLKSFMLLDAEKEEEFDKLTQEAREVFGVPTSLISLIDLGRQFFLSRTGGEGTETTRAESFCGYTVQNKEGLLVVPDAKQDDRFKDGNLVNKGPKTRFYAGAALVSPEGEKLGAFCLNGTEPRPEGLNDEEKGKLKDYAARTMELMVARRRMLRDKLAGDNVSEEMRKHAAVATSLGDIMYVEGDLETAMRLYQESVQTIMLVSEKNDKSVSTTPQIPAERQEAMVQLLTLLSQPHVPNDMKAQLLDRVRGLYPVAAAEMSDKQSADSLACRNSLNCVSGLFYQSQSGRVGGRSVSGQVPELVFCDVFKIDIQNCLKVQDKDHRPLAELDFTVPIDECSKATLFNMGQIQYHWGNQETAMQFFHLAASVSHKMSPLAFDPVDISCINNMAQIHLQYGQPEDALKMLEEALERGNRTLAALYRQTEVELSSKKESEKKEGEDEADEPEPSDTDRERDLIRTRRLRRKLARTMINIAHVQYHKSEYDQAMVALKNAVPLVDAGMTGRTLAAIWYDMAMVLQRQKKHEEALSYMDKVIRWMVKMYSAEHCQVGDSLHQKAVLLTELGRTKDALGSLDDAITIRAQTAKTNGDTDSKALVMESVELKGRLMLQEERYPEAIKCFQMVLERRQESKMDLPKAQLLLDLGRAQNAQNENTAALETYGKVLDWAKSFFGAEHAFVSRIAGIVETIPQTKKQRVN
mmetsp:Transcript_22458/g.48894  ORF Transcript_22458/g.48894 Transcript_22458/m.48894 type:complete len:763 (+) Transcript_22458:471-2759(+)